MNTRNSALWTRRNKPAVAARARTRRREMEERRSCCRICSSLVVPCTRARTSLCLMRTMTWNGSGSFTVHCGSRRIGSKGPFFSTCFLLFPIVFTAQSLCLLSCISDSCQIHMLKTSAILPGIVEEAIKELLEPVERL